MDHSTSFTSKVLLKHNHDYSCVAPTPVITGCIAHKLRLHTKWFTNLMQMVAFPEFMPALKLGDFKKQHWKKQI